MRTVTDQLNRTIEVPDKPLRIISLVPSQTELLADLGLSEEVIGITKFCIHPEKWFRTKTRVGGTKKLNMDVIRSLNPDLIIGNKEENEQSQVQELMKHYPVWMSDVKTLEDAYEMMDEIGTLVQREEQSTSLIQQIKNAFSNLKPKTSSTKLPSVAYFIWHDPIMVTGGDTFVNDMLKTGGFENIFSGQSRYPEVTAEMIQQSKPDYLFLSSEPFPFKEKHIEEYQKLFPDSRPILVDGEMFSWYGSRLLKAPVYFNSLKIRL